MSSTNSPHQENRKYTTKSSNNNHKIPIIHKIRAPKTNLRILWLSRLISYNCSFTDNKSKKKNGKTLKIKQKKNKGFGRNTDWGHEQMPWQCNHAGARTWQSMMLCNPKPLLHTLSSLLPPFLWKNECRVWILVPTNTDLVPTDKDFVRVWSIYTHFW